MWLGGKVATDTMEALKRCSGRGGDVFAKTTHGKDKIDAGNIAEIKEAILFPKI